ncbi:MAG: tol-pal system protein YbgF [Gammaproteobacteria bacterium]
MLKKVSICSIILLTSTGLVQAASLEDRVERMEKLLGNQVLMDQITDLDQIRMELAEIREMAENQEHQLELIKQRQRNLYQDMDRRMHDLEAGSPRKRSISTQPSPIAPPSSNSSIAPPVVAVVAATDGGDKEGKQAYSQAFNLLKEGRYQQAVGDFSNFLSAYPQSKFAGNAQYWLGEANYVSREYKTALKEFQKVLTEYPDSGKVQGAALKMGYTYYEMKDWDSAKTALQQVITKYPNTTFARKAEERLQRIKREGH